MESRVRVTCLCILLFLAMSLTVAVSAQEAGQSSLPMQEITGVQPPNLTGSEPKPEDAAKAILAAFDRYEIVGLSAAHGNQDLDGFILNLLRNPSLPGKINDVAVECGNSLYQPILDRYIAGEDVTLAEARQAWRNTTQRMCGESGFYEQLFPLVRRINQKLPPEKRLRVVAGDPPIDWSKVKSQKDFAQFFDRDASIASVMQKEVLAKHRKALMLFGTFHLFHSTNSIPMGLQSAVQRYEKDYPGVTLVIACHEGFGSWTPMAKYNNQWEARMVFWPVPSLVVQMKGTWLAALLNATYSTGAVVFVTKAGKDGKRESSSGPALESNKFSTMADAYLYLGPRDLLLAEPEPAEVFLNKDYMAELQRRGHITAWRPPAEQVSPDKAAEVDFNPFLYDSDEAERTAILGRDPSPGKSMQALPLPGTPPSNPQPAPKQKVQF